MISPRTKKALAAAKTRRRKPRWLSCRIKADSESPQGRSGRQRAHRGGAVAELQAAGATSLRAIAAGLNARGIPTARGIGPWSATQVLRTLARC